MFNLPRNISAGEGIDWNVVIIGATEIPIQRPKKQSSCYSGKKKAHTFKVQAIIHSRTQQILCMSKGAVHNFELFKCNFYVVSKNSFILGDKGYQGIYALYADSLLPSKAKKRCGLYSVPRGYHREMNKTRIGIEHVFGTLKTFKILVERY
ncbi:transposase family protein [Acinetobacter baylyi]|uniref:transposase family protein n=1 Tax=Acinetobacter baylyi TaxID=202950 RepID=UPI0031DC7844